MIDLYQNLAAYSSPTYINSLMGAVKSLDLLFLVINSRKRFSDWSPEMQQKGLVNEMKFCANMVIRTMFVTNKRDSTIGKEGNRVFASPLSSVHHYCLLCFFLLTLLLIIFSYQFNLIKTAKLRGGEGWYQGDGIVGEAFALHMNDLGFIPCTMCDFLSPTTSDA